jgi:hypothetical protein
MRVVEEALDAGDVRAALAIMRQAPKQERAFKESATHRPFDPFEPPIGAAAHQDLEDLLQEVLIMSPWQIQLSRADALLRSADPVHGADGLVDRLLRLEDVASTVVGGLEEARGEGLAGFSSWPERQRSDLLADATKALEGAWAIVAGEDDEDEPPKWPGEQEADRAVRLFGEALVALVASLEGAPEALEAGAGRQGARAGAQLISARAAGRLGVDGAERLTVEDLIGAMDGITDGFRELVGALIQGAAIVADAGWAEAGGPHGSE